MGAFALLATLAFVVPVLVADHYHALGIPRGDDWSYLLVQFRFVDGGGLRLNNWVSMTLVGQILLGSPIARLTGRSITAMQVSTAAFGLAGLLAVVHLGRRLSLPVAWAVLVAVMVGVGPLWAVLAPTYMTDIPAFTVGMLCLAAGAEAVRRRPVSLGWLAVSFAIGFLAFSIRQYGLIAPLAVALTATLATRASSGRARLRPVLGMTAGLVTVSVLLLLWWQTLPGAFPLSPGIPTFHAARTAAIKLTDMARLVGLLTAPAVLLAGPVRIVRRARIAAPRLTLAIVGLSTLLLVGVYLRVPQRPFVNNYVAREGALATDVLPGPRPDVMPRAAFDALVVIGTLAAVLLVVATVPFLVAGARRLLRRDCTPGDPVAMILGLTLVGYSGAYLVAQLAGLPLYDRYALPMVPLAALLVLRAGRGPEVARAQPESRPDRRSLAGGALAVAALGVVGLVFATDSASFDASRWEVATRATEQGFAPLQIDGGFEWNDFHLGHATQLPPQYGGPQTLPKDQQDTVEQCVRLIVNPRSARGRVVASVESRALGRPPTDIVAFWDRRCVPYHGTGRSGSP